MGAKAKPPKVTVSPEARRILDDLGEGVVTVELLVEFG